MDLEKSKLLISVLLATLQVGLGQDTFNEKPVVNRKFEVPVLVDPEKTYDPFTNETDSSAFNDSAIIDEFNEQYLHRMVARTAAIALASLSADLKECKDEDSQCSRWAKEGYCFSNAGYMSIACQRSCDVCDLSICADNHERCEEWAAENECSKNKGYMRVACRKSCGVCGSYGSAPVKPSNERSSWKKFPSTDCYEGKGGDPVAGLPDPYSNSLTLQECQDVCQQSSSCEGIIRESSDGESEGLCYLRVSLNLEKCVDDSIWELYLKTNEKESEDVEKESSQTQQKWSKSSGVDCYEGKGGVAIQPDPYSNSIGLEGCREACEATKGCVAIIRKATDGVSPGLCYLRSQIQKSSCVQDPLWDLHQFDEDSTTVKPSTEKPSSSWTNYGGRDCYEGAGGQAIQPDPYSQSLSLEDCKSSCMSNPSCVGIIRKTSDGSGNGICYLRSSIQLSKCDSQTEWDLYLNKRNDGDFHNKLLNKTSYFDFRWINY